MEAGSELGCATKTGRGALPNEHGTWYFGRNGWCDGQDVKPLVWDVTSAVNLNLNLSLSLSLGGLPGSGAGAGANTLRYYAQSFPDGEPPTRPDDKGCAGNIDMTGYLVYY